MIETIIVGIFTGVATGFTVGIVTVKHAINNITSPPTPTVDNSFNDRDLDDAAHRWAASVGRPGFGPYAAKHLRNAAQIQRNRQQRAATRRRFW